MFYQISVYTKNIPRNTSEFYTYLMHNKKNKLFVEIGVSIIYYRNVNTNYAIVCIYTFLFLTILTNWISKICIWIYLGFYNFMLRRSVVGNRISSFIIFSIQSTNWCMRLHELKDISNLVVMLFIYHRSC